MILDRLAFFRRDDGRWWPVLLEDQSCREVLAQQVLPQQRAAYHRYLLKHTLQQQAIQTVTVAHLLGTNEVRPVYRRSKQLLEPFIEHGPLMLQRYPDDADYQAAMAEVTRLMQQEEPPLTTSSDDDDDDDETPVQSNHRRHLSPSITPVMNLNQDFGPCGDHKDDDDDEPLMAADIDDDEPLVNHDDDDEMVEENLEENKMAVDDDDDKVEQQVEEHDAVDKDGAAEAATENESPGADDPEDPEIKASDSWTTVWNKLQFTGWSRRKTGDDFCYTKPGFQSAHPDAVEGRDYFTSTQDLQDYCIDHYGWQPVATPEQPTQPQDPAKPLLPTPDSEFSFASSVDESERYEQNNLWPILKDKGWTYVNAPSKDLTSTYWFVRPGLERKVSNAMPWSKVVEYVQQRERTRERSRSISIAPLNLAEALPVRSSRKRKVPRVSMSAIKRSSPRSQTRTTVPRKRAKIDFWWKSTPVPSPTMIWKILQKLGYRQENDRFWFPDSVYTKYGGEKVTFASLTGLRKFFCKYGIPNEAMVVDTLRDADMEALNRWITFANVNVTHNNSRRKLRALKAPRNEDDTKALLYKHGFQSAGDGRLYVPHSDQLARRGGIIKRKHKLHYFLDTELTTEVRVYVRGCWDLLLELDDDDDETQEEQPLSEMSQAVAVDESKTLKLALWAATSSADLPEFKSFPEEQEIRRLKLVLDEPEDEPMSSPEPSPERPEPTSRKESKKPVIDRRPFWQKPMLSDDVVEHALRVFGFEFGDRISHPMIADDFDNLQSLLEFLVKEGIPNFADKNKETDKDILLALLLRIQFANFPDRRKLADLEIPSDKKIHELILAMGCQTYDGKFCPPGVDRLGLGRTRKEGVHVFTGLDGILSWIRGAKVLSLSQEWLDERGHQLSEDDLLSLRLRAALVDKPLPTFVPEAHVKRVRDTEDMEVDAHSGKQEEDMDVDDDEEDDPMQTVDDSTETVEAAEEMAAGEPGVTGAKKEANKGPPAEIPEGRPVEETATMSESPEEPSTESTKETMAVSHATESPTSVEEKQSAAKEPVAEPKGDEVATKARAVEGPEEEGVDEPQEDEGAMDAGTVATATEKPKEDDFTAVDEVEHAKDSMEDGIFDDSIFSEETTEIIRRIDEAQLGMEPDDLMDGHEADTSGLMTQFPNDDDDCGSDADDDLNEMRELAVETDFEVSPLMTQAPADDEEDDDDEGDEDDDVYVAQSQKKAAPSMQYDSLRLLNNDVTTRSKKQQQRFAAREYPISVTTVLARLEHKTGGSASSNKTALRSPINERGNAEDEFTGSPASVDDFMTPPECDVATNDSSPVGPTASVPQQQTTAEFARELVDL